MVTTTSYYYPQTPSVSSPSPSSSRHNPIFQYKPLNSSPLIDGDLDHEIEGGVSPKSSPLSAAQARRRRGMYKAAGPHGAAAAAGPVTPMNASGRRVSSSSYGPNVVRGSGRIKPLFGAEMLGSSRRTSSSSLSLSLSSPGGAGGSADTQKTLLRDKLKARCLERAVKAREKAVKGRRGTTGSEANLNSDDVEMEDEEGEEGDEDIMQDEAGVANANRKQTHSYRVSYALEVGSSFDPDLEDVDRWEQELSGGYTTTTATTNTNNSSDGTTTTAETLVTPDDLDDEELEEYAEEYARLKALEDFADLGEDELFNWSEDEEEDFGSSGTVVAAGAGSGTNTREKEEDVSMDMS
ncbi:hypothetical protein D9613_008374 [Agrocybe pediades]|uniref:Uncharacterized protein n=1 Tax=Agrocybe pediades TaxID=84607 RepID=A0A8H4QT00_9AGAR|nr:hypothetical protein D9613_008374 [Agrocybe pediades]